MNRENLERTIAHLENLPPELGFEMSRYINKGYDDAPVFDYKGDECGTAACIAGHIALLESGGDDEKVWDREDGPKGLARKFLGLTHDQAELLFIPHHTDLTPVNAVKRNTLSDVTLPWAIRTLKHLLETGKIDWRATV